MQAELETQWNLIDGIACQAPDPRLQRDGIHALALNNVWGNVMDADFYPARRHPRSLDEMEELTEQLRRLAMGATSDNAAVRLQEVYELLHDTARNKEFVSRHGEGDLQMLTEIAALNSSD